MSDLKVGEAFKDKVYITTTATGAAKAGLATVTCVVIDESGNRAAGVVAEESDGWYTCSFTPDASGTWSTEWDSGDASLYTVYFAPKIFKVGGGTIADIYGKVDTEVGSLQTAVNTVATYHDKPAQNSADNAYIRDVVGNKTDTTAGTSLVSLIKIETAALAVVDEYHDVPAQNAAANSQINEVIGNKTDTTAGTSLVSLVKVVDGNVDDIKTYTVKPDADTNDNDNIADIVGNKEDTANSTVGNTSSLMRYTKAIIGDTVYIADAALPAAPTASSLAAQIGNFIASGDGDFAGGTKLPSNISLYDLIGGTNGHSAYPAAAAPANGVNLMAVAHLIADRTEHHLITRTWFSDSQVEVVADTSHTDASLPSVVLPNIAGTIVHVYAGFKFRMIENTNAAANKLSGAQEIQVKENAAGAFTDAINFVDDQFGLAASTREGGDCIIGDIDIVAEVAAFNKTYAFQWDEPLTDQNALHFNDVQTFLIVSYY